MVMASVGLVAGVVYAGGGLVYEVLNDSLNSGTALAFLALLGMPAVLGLFGFTTGILGASLYNVAMRWFAGIDLDIERRN